MSERSAALLEQALALPEGERAELLERLLASFDTEERRRIDESWAAEVEERIDALERGEMGAVPASEVFGRINESLKKC